MSNQYWVGNSVQDSNPFDSSDRSEKSLVESGHWLRNRDLIVIVHLFLRQKAITSLENLCLLLQLARLLNRRFSRETKLLYSHGLDPKIWLSAEWKRIWISMCWRNIKDLPGTHFASAKNSSQWILQKHLIKIIKNNKLWGQWCIHKERDIYIIYVHAYRKFFLLQL